MATHRRTKPRSMRFQEDLWDAIVAEAEAEGSDNATAWVRATLRRRLQRRLQAMAQLRERMAGAERKHG